MQDDIFGGLADFDISPATASSQPNWQRAAEAWYSLVVRWGMPICGTFPEMVWQ